MWSSFRHSLCLCSAASEGAEQFRGWGAVPTGGNCHIHSVVSVDYFPSLWFSWSSSKWVTRLPNLSFPRVKDKFLLAFSLNFRLLFLCLPDPIALNKFFSSSVVFLPFRWLLVPIILLNQVLFNQVLIFCIPPFLHDWTSWRSWPQLKILIVNFLVLFLSSVILEAFLALSVLHEMAFGFLLLSKNMNRDCPGRLIALFSSFLWRWWNWWSCYEQVKMKRRVKPLLLAEMI